MRRRAAGYAALLGALLVPLLGALVIGWLPGVRLEAAAATGSRPTLGFEVRGGGTTYVGGQGLFLVGSLGRPGVRKVVVESNMNRPGDTWRSPPPPGYAGTTAQDGSFRVPILAPSMFDISYRIRSGDLVTPGVTFNAKTQDLDLWVSGSEDYTRPVEPLVLVPFSIVADTTPHFYHRPTTVGLPVLQGRRVTLLRRSSPSGWQEVATARVRADGRAVFPALVETDPGDVAYRVREEVWRGHGSDVGWTWSWPLGVHVRALLEAPSYVEEGEATPGNVAGNRGPQAQHPDAASRYHWGAFRWDYDWTRGESLDDPPTVGTERRGRWSEVGTGLGRVTRTNGGLMVSSGKLVRDGRGDIGTTSALLRGGAASTGRWEAQLSLSVAEKDFVDYDAVLELVPAATPDARCAPTVTIAQWTGLGRRMTIGVDHGRDRWRRTLKTTGVAHTIPMVAVEVGTDHITWFLDGRPIGTVRDRSALPKVPLTLQMSLVGDEREHDNSSLFSDWQRAYALGPGQQVTRAPALHHSRASGC